MKRLAAAFALAAGLGAGTSPAAWGQQALVGEGERIAQLGVRTGIPPCSACHGADGGGQAAAGIPRLTGLTAPYLQAQLRHFAEGSRVNPIMTPYAKMLTEAQRQEVAAYYVSLPVTDAVATAAPAELVAGRQLMLHGLPTSAMPSCSQCHGETGLGVGDFSPRLAGQSAAYIADQLREWQTGERHDREGSFMRTEVAHLSAADISAIAAYLAALPTIQGAAR